MYSGLEDFEVTKINGKIGKDIIRSFHYSRSCHNGPMCWGLVHKGTGYIEGVCAFATPCSENVRASLFGQEHKDRVTELHRLYTYDWLPKNAESWFVSRAIKGLLEYRPQIRGIISFADMTEGHDGGIYRALNFQLCGTTSRATFYRDQDGRLRHPRQCGENITREKAKSLGWVPEQRDGKLRYILVVGPNKRERKRFRKLLKPDNVGYSLIHDYDL